MCRVPLIAIGWSQAGGVKKPRVCVVCFHDRSEFLGKKLRPTRGGVATRESGRRVKIGGVEIVVLGNA